MRRNNNVTGSAFIEFNSPKTAKYFINEYNNKRVNGHLFCLNWAKHNYNKNNKEKEKEKEKEIINNTSNLYTVSIIYFFLILILIQIYVGNLDISINEKELTAYFKKSFSSVVSSRIIRDSVSGKSRGFGFVNFTDIDQYEDLLKHNQDACYLKGRILTIK